MMMNMDSAAVPIKTPAFYSGCHESKAAASANSNWRPAKISLASCSAAGIADSMRSCMSGCAGVFELEDIDAEAPFDSIRALFKLIKDQPGLAKRANAAYTNNLVFKDSYGQGKGGKFRCFSETISRIVPFSRYTTQRQT